MTCRTDIAGSGWEPGQPGDTFAAEWPRQGRCDATRQRPDRVDAFVRAPVEHQPGKTMTGTRHATRRPPRKATNVSSHEGQR